MNTLPLAPTSGRMARSSSGTTLHVVAVYDSPANAVEVQAAEEALTMAAGPDVSIQCLTWSFDMLVRLDVRHLSIREAARADILILSASGKQPLPAHIIAWVTTCLQQSGHGAPVLTALHPEVLAPEPISPLCDFLSNTAVLWQTDFLCNEDFTVGLEQGLVAQLLQRRRHQEIETDPTEAGHPEISGFRWGIND